MKAESRKQKAESRKQKAGKILCMAIVSALLAACSSSSGGGGGNGIRSSGPSSISEVPAQYQDSVSKEKTISLVDNSNGEKSQITLNGKTNTYNFSDLPNGLTAKLPISQSYQDAQGKTTNYSGTLLVYQQPYSVITGVTWTAGSGAEFDEAEDLNHFETMDETLGFSTPWAALGELINQDALFQYKGVAFDGKEEGTLNYTMLFGQREGHGTITGFASTGSIRLWPAQLTNDGFIRGKARLEGVPSGKRDVEYKLSFFGPNAEELAGSVFEGKDESALGHNDIIFAGKGSRIN